MSAADSALEAEKRFIESADSGWSYTSIFVIAIVLLAGAFLLWKRSKSSAAAYDNNDNSRYRNNYSRNGGESDGVDADKELAWLRRAKKGKKKGTASAGDGDRKDAAVSTARAAEHSIDTRVFQEKMRKMQYSQLPINSFERLSPSRAFAPLPASDDPALANAIEQANDEFEEDEAVRDLAARVLAAFKTHDSVEALSQIALYDLSSNLRSKAVSTLTDFDHESVFETILLACADPTREVRAAAARGLFRLNFDRADAWKRIIETNDEYRMNHAARAATEAGIVVKSFDRLIHDDLKIAYEAFALIMLMIRSGETHEIFEAIRTHKDERVRFALLHVLKSARDERTVEALHEIQKDSRLSTEVAERVRDVINSVEAVAA